ncbi:hypothetical protein HOG98_04960 [bacterium]|jgi:tetratricopeptide (TPR) repeat protein|nr:hypothetical protein [bacterium]
MQRRNKIIATKQSQTNASFVSEPTYPPINFDVIYSGPAPSAPPAPPSYLESMSSTPVATLIDSSVPYGNGDQNAPIKEGLADVPYVGVYASVEAVPNIINATPIPEQDYKVDDYASCFSNSQPIVSNFEGKRSEVNQMTSKNWHLEAETYLNAGNFDGAIFYLNGAIFHDSTNPNLFNDRRQAHLDAADFYSGLSKNEPQMNVQGMSLTHKNISADYLGLALTDTLHAQSLDKQNPMIKANLATVLLKMEQFDRAIVSIDDAIRSSSKTEIFKYIKAQILKSQVLFLSNKEMMSMPDSLQKETSAKIKDKTKESLQNYAVFISDMEKGRRAIDYPAQYRRALLDSAELYLMRGKGGFWQEDITDSMRFLEKAENYELASPTKELSQAWATLYLVLNLETLSQIETSEASSFSDNTSLDPWILKRDYSGKEGQVKKVFKSWVSDYTSLSETGISPELKVKRYQKAMLGLSILNVRNGKLDKAEQRLSLACNASKGPYLKLLFQERANVANKRGREEDACLFRSEASKFKELPTYSRV